MASTSSTALQRLATAKDAKEGCLQVKPLMVVPTSSHQTNEDECLALPRTAQVTIAVAGQVRSSTLFASDPVVVAAPLSHLYQSRLHVQVEFPSKVTYRGSYSVDELPIHQTSILSIPLERKDALAVPSSSTDSTSPAQNIALRLECQLQGPRRTEIVKAHQAVNAWLTVVDQVEDVIRETWSKLAPQIPDAAKKKETLLLVIPAVFSIIIPTTVACLVISPVVIGFCILFFPIMIPLVVGICLFVVATVVGTGAIMGGVFASSRYGRKQLSSWWQSQTTLREYWNVVRGPQFGLQTLYYATGPRPTPVTLTRTQMPKEKWRRLGVSLTIDGMGSFSYLLPFLGEAFDVVWAPAQTILIMALYQHVSPNMSYVSFAEEILPFLDAIPTATAGWLMEFGPELLEEAKGLVGNPQNLQVILWGSNSNANAPASTPRSSAANRRPLPTERPSRH